MIRHGLWELCTVGQNILVMARRLLFVCFALFIFAFSQAQNRTVSGMVSDQQTKKPLGGATVQLSSLSDSSRHRSITDSLGRFVFPGLKKDSFLLSVSYVGYNSVSRIIAVDTADVTLKIGAAIKSNADLATVIIQTTVSPVTQRQDTIQFNASQYKVNPDANAEDLVRKMPGITVQNGQVTANGENVQKVTIDGRDLFGDDATAALRNLPAEVIDKIQVFDRLSDQAQFTGFDDGNTQKSINIITKANMRNGQFGRVFAGYGTNSRYNAGGNTTMLHGDRKISLVGNFNNINQQNFATQDLLGVSNNGGQRGGGGGGFRGGGGGQRGGGGGGAQRGGGGFGGFGANSNFLVGNQSGINTTNSFGVNYADNWGKKVQITGSYFFNNQKNITQQITNTQYYSSANDNADTTNSTSNNYNHRVNMRFDYKIDSANELLIIPSLGFQSNNTNRNDLLTNFLKNSTPLNSIGSASDAKTSGNNLNNTILYRHAFPKKGRTVSINLNSSYNKRDGENYLDQSYHTFSTGSDSTINEYVPQTNSGYQIAGNLAYTEPIGKTSQLQLNYNPTYSNSKADQETFFMGADNKYSRFDDSLSSKFNSIYKTQNGGVSYRYGTRDNQISFGANYQHSDLSSQEVFPYEYTLHKTFDNILPNAMLRLKLSTRSSLRVFYRASENQPSVTQLQDVVDKVSNAPYVVLGNPNLAQQTNNLLSTRYTFTNPGKGMLFVANIFLQNAKNYITNATYIPVLGDSIITHGDTLFRGQQLTQPINMNGYLSLRSFLTFAIPIKPIKSQLNFNGGVTYNKLPGINNRVELMTKSITYTSGVVIASNISQYVDFTISYSANFNRVQSDVTTAKSNSNTNYFSHTASAQLNLLSKKGWFYQTDLTNELTSGYTQGFNQNYFLWNMGAGKKFLKNQRGELKLNVFDVLGQNQSITRNVQPGIGIQDVQNVVLRRFAMLTFTYNLRNFGKGTARTNNQNTRNSNFNRGNGEMRF